MKKKLLFSSILSVIMCVSLIVGATFALFESESNVNIAITSGKVDVVATIDEGSVQTKNLNSDYAPEDGNMYQGEATFTREGLTLKKFLPGDGIKFNIVVENKGSVIIKYRAIITCYEDDGLFAGLKVDIGNKENYNGYKYFTDWAILDYNGSSIDTGISTLPL